jgi:glucose dehydrogenase
VQCRFFLFLIVFAVRTAAIVVALSATAFAQGDWPAYGHDPGGMRFSPLNEINAANVAQLRRAWTYHTGEHPPSAGPRGQCQTAFETTPLIVRGVLYFSTPANRIIALDPASGRELWKFDPQSNARQPIKYRAHRGVAFWPGDKDATARILFGTLDGRLIALNANGNQNSRIWKRRRSGPAPGSGRQIP